LGARLLTLRAAACAASVGSRAHVGTARLSARRSIVGWWLAPRARDRPQSGTHDAAGASAGGAGGAQFLADRGGSRGGRGLARYARLSRTRATRLPACPHHARTQRVACAVACGTLARAARACVPAKLLRGCARVTHGAVGTLNTFYPKYQARLARIPPIRKLTLCSSDPAGPPCAPAPRIAREPRHRRHARVRRLRHAARKGHCEGHRSQHGRASRSGRGRGGS